MADSGVVIYTSSVGGSIKVSKETSSIKFLLDSQKIPYTEVDLSLAENEEKKKYMAEKSGSRTIPKIFVDGEFKGDAEGLQYANEDGMVKQYLGLA